jgi:hypothetical protein
MSFNDGVIDHPVNSRTIVLSSRVSFYAISSNQRGERTPPPLVQSVTIRAISGENPARPAVGLCLHRRRFQMSSPAWRLRA